MRRALVGFVALGLVAVLAVSGLRRARRTPSSLLLVTIDTLRADRVGAYGSALGLTPTIDALAAKGWLFEHAVSSVPLTLPSHATLLSGLDPLHHGVRNNGTYVFPAARETLATRLRLSGYATGAFVGAVVLDRRYGLDRGFDVYDDRIARVNEGKSVLESERPCEVVVDNARAWIKEQTGPFFAWVHVYEPHAPYAPPPDMAARYPDHPYEAEVATADRCLAELVTASTGARPDRLVVAVASDHGEGLGDHGELTHGLFLYQSTLEVPMVIAGTSVPSGKRSASLTRTADLAPTLLALLGVPGLGAIDGRDLTVEGGAGESYAETDYPAGFGWASLRSWRLNDLKLIEAPEVELYDLAHDPKEERNLASARAPDLERLRGVLHAASKSEVRGDAHRANGETEERLRSLGYVAGGSAAPAAGAKALDPKAALPLFRDFERAMERDAAGDLKASVAILADLVKAEPANLTFRRSLASALSRVFRVEDAIRVLREAQVLAPQDASVAHDLAVALAEKGSVDEAMGFESRAIALDPGFVDALNHLAILQARRGDLGKARESVDRAIGLDPNNARAWSNRGNIARGQGQADEALRSYDRALALAPEQVEALNGLGVLAVEGGRLDDAAQRFERVLAVAPAFDEARLNLAVVESQRGRLGRAIELATQTEKGAQDPHVQARAAAFLRDLQSSAR